MSYRNLLYIPRYQNGHRSPTVSSRQRLTADCTLACACTQTIHTSDVTKCSVLCVGHFSHGYGFNCQRGTPARECDRDRRASETVEQRRKALRAENKTGPGALPGVRKNEKLHYSGWVLTAGAEWPIKLQMRVRPTCSDYV